MKAEQKTKTQLLREVRIMRAKLKKLEKSGEAAQATQDALPKSDDWNLSVIETSGDAILLTLPRGRILAANPAACRMFGRTETELCEVGLTGIIDMTESGNRRVMAEWDRTGRFTGEITHLRRDGRPFPAEVTSTVFKDPEGNLRTSMIIRDITERKRAESELKQKTDDLSLLNSLNAASNRDESLEMIFNLLADRLKDIFSSQGTTVYLPSEDKKHLIMQVLAIPPAVVNRIEQLTGLQIPAIRIPMGENSLYRRIWREGKPNLTNDPETIRHMIAELSEETALKMLVPAILNLLESRTVITLPLIADKDLIAMINIFRKEPFTRSDLERIGSIGEELSAILQRKRAGEEIREAHEELTSLHNHLNKVREEERTRVSREIHDELGQILTTVKIDLSLLESKLTPEQTDLACRCRSMQELVDRTITTVQRISSQLRPGLLDDLGLGAAIEWQTQEFQKRTGIECSTSIAAVADLLDGEKRIEIFRMFQEAITNVARHSKATKLDIFLAEERDSLILGINDNGIGIDPARMDDRNSLGILGMRERVRSVGGSISISGSPGCGTRVTIEVPLAENPTAVPAEAHKGMIHEHSDRR